MTLKPVDGPTFTQSGQQHTYQGLRIGSGAGAGNFEASTMLQSTSAFNYAGNFAGFQDPQYTQLVLSATTEPDAAKRKQVYSQLNDYLLDQSFTFAFPGSRHRPGVVESPRAGIQRLGRAQLHRCLVGLVTPVHRTQFVLENACMQTNDAPGLVWRAAVKLGSIRWRER